MAYPSGVFSSSRSGRLMVTFSGVFSFNSSDWGNGNTWELVIRCYVGDGSSRLTGIISMKVNTAVIEYDYTAGTSVSVGMELVTTSFGGAGTIRARPLRVRCRLMKNK